MLTGTDFPPETNSPAAQFGLLTAPLLILAEAPQVCVDENVTAPAQPGPDKFTGGTSADTGVSLMPAPNDEVKSKLFVTEPAVNLSVFFGSLKLNSSR